MFRNRSPFGKSNSSFAVEPQKEITRIELSQGGTKLSLYKEGENWLINNKIETRKSGVLFILRVLREIKIKSPVSEELFEKEISAKELVPVKVKIYDKRKLLNSFLDKPSFNFTNNLTYNYNVNYNNTYVKDVIIL